MATYKNFYETLVEAQMRLRASIVIYDREPVYVWAVTDHKGDGAFRVYITPIDKLKLINQGGGFPVNQVPGTHPSMGPKMDEWMAANPDSPLLRKKMDSPLFNKFRPFPLGMYNYNGFAYYTERQPQRPKTEQGLTEGAVMQTHITTSPTNEKYPMQCNMFTEGFRDCILGKHPSPKEVLDGLTSDEFVNTSVAFDRHFALARGPIDTLFLGYKRDIIGVLPHADFSTVTLGQKFHHCKEVVEDLSLFASIRMKR
jgi:hypothetical protein